MSDDSVSLWISQLTAGDAGAAQHLWERYFQRLVGLARKKLQDAPRRAADEEDVALSAFDSFCRAAEGAASPGSATATVSGGCSLPSPPARPSTWCATSAGRS